MVIYLKLIKNGLCLYGEKMGRYSENKIDISKVPKNFVKKELKVRWMK